MTPKDNSLQKYNYGLTNSGQPANNFCRPNVTNFKPESGRLYQIQYENIMTSSPKVNWNSYNTKDPILNFGSTSTNIGGSGFIETMGKIASGISLFGGIAMTGLGIANAVQTIKAANSNQSANGVDNFSRKEVKEINKGSVDASGEMNSLDYAITNAENLGDTDNVDDINSATKLLNAAKEEASLKKADALGAINNANKKIETTQKAKREATSALGKLAETKASYMKELSSTDPAPTPERKAELEKLIKQAEKDIQSQKDLIAEYDRQIEVQNTIINQNNETIKQLNENSAKADKLVSKFAAKLNVK